MLIPPPLAWLVRRLWSGDLERTPIQKRQHIGPARVRLASLLRGEDPRVRDASIVSHRGRTMFGPSVARRLKNPHLRDDGEPGPSTLTRD